MLEIKWEKDADGVLTLHPTILTSTEEGVLSDSDGCTLRRWVAEYIASKRQTALPDLLRLVALMVIALAAIVCIAWDKERIYFTNILTFTLGVIVDSPFSTKQAQPSEGPALPGDHVDAEDIYTDDAQPS